MSIVRRHHGITYSTVYTEEQSLIGLKTHNWRHMLLLSKVWPLINQWLVVLWTSLSRLSCTYAPLRFMRHPWFVSQVRIVYWFCEWCGHFVQKSNRKKMAWPVTSLWASAEEVDGHCILSSSHAAFNLYANISLGVSSQPTTTRLSVRPIYARDACLVKRTKMYWTHQRSE